MNGVHRSTSAQKTVPKSQKVDKLTDLNDKLLAGDYSIVVWTFENVVILGFLFLIEVFMQEIDAMLGVVEHLCLMVSVSILFLYGSC